MNTDGCLSLSTERCLTSKMTVMSNDLKGNCWQSITIQSGEFSSSYTNILKCIQNRLRYSFSLMYPKRLEFHSFSLKFHHFHFHVVY